MKLMRDGRSLGHLTYCSNIHPGESWHEVESNLHQHIPEIRQALSPAEPFGIGLRLSAAATRDLNDEGELAKLREFLDTEKCYVFTLNGFPYGPFHGTRVKEEVYLPDWQDAERLRYTNQLADVLAAILPSGQRGSISTVPGAFKASVKDDAAIEQMTNHFVDHVAHLVDIELTTGKEIVLALEPEPCCFLETIAETVAYFRDHLFGEQAAARLVDRLADHLPDNLSDRPANHPADNLSDRLSTRQHAQPAGLVDGDRLTQATSLLKRHLTLCLDICHAAIEFEDIDACLTALAEADIAIGKLQISAGLRLENVTEKTAERLRPFVDSTYLHQVVERHGDALTRFVDLPDALSSLSDANGADREWRVHFHVPVFLDDLGDFSSTRFFIEEVLARHVHEPLSDHLEVETYTWNVLPPRYRDESVDVAIVRELDWVRETLLR